MTKTVDNRLERLFEDFVSSKEWPYKNSNNVWRLGILMSDRKLVQVRFTFNSSGEGYEFAAPLAKVPHNKQSEFSLNILKSKSMRGMTERLIGESFLVLGSRDGLKHLADEEVERLFRNDLARIRDYYEKLDKLLVDDISDEDSINFSTSDHLQTGVIQGLLQRLFGRT